MSESKTEGGAWGGEALALWSSVEAGSLPAAAGAAAAGAASALLLQLLNYSGSAGACKRGDSYQGSGSGVVLSWVQREKCALNTGFQTAPCSVSLLVFGDDIFSLKCWGALKAMAC